MRSIPLGISSLSINRHNQNLKKQTQPFFSNSSSSTSCRVSLSHQSSSPSKLGVCRASQVVELFSTVSPEIVVREARMEDIWEVAETHCSCFFPNYTFPLDLMLRVNRLVAMLSGFTAQRGTRRTCLVAVIGSSMDEAFFLGSEDFKLGGFDCKFSLHRGYVTGILTVDTVADFLPRKGPLRRRRTGIAYISNVAVREKYRRKGIAKKLIAKAEAQAKSWGCRSIALHCDLNNPGATKLYKGQGFKCIKVPEGANWPQPKTSPDAKFNFMMKLLKAPTTTTSLLMNMQTR